MPGTKLQEHSGSEKAWVYTTVDFADEEQKPELFCIRFASPESKHRMHALQSLSSSAAADAQRLVHLCSVLLAKSSCSTIQLSFLLDI